MVHPAVVMVSDTLRLARIQDLRRLSPCAGGCSSGISEVGRHRTEFLPSLPPVVSDQFADLYAERGNLAQDHRTGVDLGSASCDFLRANLHVHGDHDQTADQTFGGSERAVVAGRCLLLCFSGIRHCSLQDASGSASKTVAVASGPV